MTILEAVAWNNPWQPIIIAFGVYLLINSGAAKLTEDRRRKQSRRPEYRATKWMKWAWIPGLVLMLVGVVDLLS